jgi:hypothetical protein
VIEFRQWLESTEAALSWVGGDRSPVPGPDCSEPCAARFTSGRDEYFVDFEPFDDEGPGVSVAFRTSRTGHFLTRSNQPFSALSSVMAAIRSYLAHCPKDKIHYHPYDTKRNQVFRRLFARWLPEFQDQGEYFVRKGVTPPRPPG